jgi:hypothetical protein
MATLGTDILQISIEARNFGTSHHSRLINRLQPDRRSRGLSGACLLTILRGFAGACLANSEMDLTGKEAVMAWKVTDCHWNGVSLDGLSVALVATSEKTRGPAVKTGLRLFE